MGWIVPEAALVSPVVYVVIAAAATLLIGVSKGGFGGGVGVLATPMVLLCVPANIALSLVLPLLIVSDVFTLRHFPHDWHARSFWLIAPGTFVGLGVGLFFLLLFAREDVDGDRWIKLIVGIVSLTFCVLQGLGALRRRQVEFKPGPVVGSVTGVLCGFSTMVAHAAGAFVNMFLLAQRMDQRRFVGTCARYYLTFNTLKIPFYVAASLLGEKSYLTVQTLKWDLWLVPLCPIGVALGAWMNRRLSGKAFTLVVYVLLAITGCKMIYDAM
jgi:uncharacterized membrane protein YfcA